MTAFSCRFSGIPPNRATSGFLPSPLSTVTCRHVLRPCGVSTLALYLAAIFRPVVWCLHASVFSSEARMTPLSQLSRWTSLASR